MIAVLSAIRGKRVCYGYILFLEDDGEYDIFIHIDNDSILLYNSIKYVHQLQNLYFALSGEELTIKY